MNEIKRALISVYDKTGIVEFAKELNSFGVEILSTGGTAKLLQKEGIQVTEVSNYTGFPEILDGRLKTLHPKIHGGILAKRNDAKHLEQIKELGIGFIDMVVINLYPFREVIKKPNVSLEEVIENIDIGGPTMLRSAAKNYQDVAVVCSPDDYDTIIKELKENDGKLSLETHKRLSAKVFDSTYKYDSAISFELNKRFGIKQELFPKVVSKNLEILQELRYGENSHQKAAFYIGDKGKNFEQLGGKELSFNNLLDLDAAWSAVQDFDDSAAVIMKHMNPCGLACHDNLLQAYKNAHLCDPLSAFGSIVSFNRKVPKDVAEEITKTFVEVVIAPDYEDEAIKVLQEKQALRIIKMPVALSSQTEIRCALDGYLIQQKDYFQIEKKDMKVATKVQPTDAQWKELLFAWRVVKNIKSNAIVLCKELRTIGVGAGQMSRIDSMKLALTKACPVRDSSLNGACQLPEDTVLASDAFFPFSDVVEEAHKAGIVAIIQPGGSKRDQDSIDACDKYGIAMVLTGERHFRH
ncbi:bifunctional phosphoribosylaminoimidazolecarboxamide formyltransferase/IMP cyclohydrolase [bacterium]|nr:bifunctional phosphoribosylaminoimidazolecarboxamide formyltransferase/IMP cyclohydrolase [bacterium]